MDSESQTQGPVRGDGHSPCVGLGIWRGGNLVVLVNRAAADDGAENARLGELRGRNLSEIVREDDEISVFPLFQLTLLPFLELRVSGT